MVNYDPDRAGRITWKLVRGVYFEGAGRFLPHYTPKRLILIDPRDYKEVPGKYPYFDFVRATRPMGRHGRVLDYKWIGVRFAEDKVRAHLMTMMLWEHLVFIAIFHDPTCVCLECEQARISREPVQLITLPDVGTAS